MARASGPLLVNRVTDAVVDSGRLPDPVLRRAIRSLLRRRLADLNRGTVEEAQEAKRRLIHQLRTTAVTVAADQANAQHYEVPAEFFRVMLGRHLKYSCAYWPAGVTSLDAAEEAMLRLTAERAQLVDGQDVLELGCGWGSLTLWMAEHNPSSRITAVSNSNSQREHILKQAAERGLDNVEVLTADVADLHLPAEGFDRVVSVEMFEHVRNHAELFRRVHAWLRPGGKLFVHVFANRQWPYLFEVGSGGDWMSRNFFTGGVMPSDDLFLHLSGDLVADDHWIVGGEHYAATCQAWIDNLDADRDGVLRIFGDVYGRDRAAAWLHRWRTFDLACLELFAFDGGREWFVSHRRFAKGGTNGPSDE